MPLPKFLELDSMLVIRIPEDPPSPSPSPSPSPLPSLLLLLLLPKET